MEALTKEIADKLAFQVTKIPGTDHGLTIVTASPLVNGKTFFLHKVFEVNPSNFINLKNDLITKIVRADTNTLNHYEFMRLFLDAKSYSYVRFVEKEKTELIEKL